VNFPPMRTILSMHLALVAQAAHPVELGAITRLNASRLAASCLVLTFLAW